MVGEFPELQGVMGRHYALASGEKPEVAEALLEAYLPRFAGDALPASELGAILSVAERMDTIAAIFGIGMAPTGSEDPYALRRHTLAVINILAERAWPVHLKSIVELAIATLTGKITRPAEGLRAEVLEFFRGRLENLYASGGAPVDIVRAVLAAGFDQIPEVGQAHRRAGRAAQARGLRRAGRDLQARREHRAARTSRGRSTRRCAPRPPERELAAAATGIRADVDAAVRERDYLKALRKIAELRPVVDRFFDGVMVMAEDPALRNNRLALLAAVQRLFADIADFRQIAAG